MNRNNIPAYILILVVAIIFFGVVGVRVADATAYSGSCEFEGQTATHYHQTVTNQSQTQNSNTCGGNGYDQWGCVTKTTHSAVCVNGSWQNSSDTEDLGCVWLSSGCSAGFPSGQCPGGCSGDGGGGGGGGISSYDLPDLIFINTSTYSIPNGAPGTVANFEVDIYNYPYDSFQVDPAPTEGSFEVAFNNNATSMGCSTAETGRYTVTTILDPSEGINNIPLSFTRPSTPGTYNITVMVDADCGEGESRETNNTYHFTYTVTNPQCQDNIDNDGDGVKDYPADPGCESSNDDSETTQCQDGIDNDGDTLTDLADPGCADINDDNEGDGTSQCQDGIDNDGDGRIDYGDEPACASAADNDEGDDPSRPGPVAELAFSFSTPGDKSLSVAVTDVTQNTLGPAACPLVTVATPPISIDLTSNPESGYSPLTVVLNGEILSGYIPALSVNYTFWWNCNNTTTSVSVATSACGDPTNSTNGAKFDGLFQSSFLAQHVYSNGTQNPITVNPKVIIEHGSASPKTVVETVVVDPPLSDVVCAPSELSATPNTSRTFSASGGSGSYSWSVAPSANCSPTSGTGDDFTVSCTTNGTREIQVDDDNPDTAGGSCILRIARPGFIEI